MIETGTTIVLELKNDNTNEQNKTYRCRVVDYINSQLVVDYPIDVETNKQSYFLEGTEFNASFVGKDEAVYVLNTEIVGRSTRNVPVLLLKDPGKETYIRIQRRNYVRVETAIDVAIYPMDHSYPPFRTVTWDISGGGCAVIVPEEQPFPTEGEVKIWLSIHLQSGEICYFHTISKIIRVIPSKGTLNKRVSLEFISLTKEERQLVVRYCFEKQLEQRRKKRI